MELAEFYAAVLPPTGDYALFSAKQQRHQWSSTLDQLVKRTVARADEPDLYFATGSFLNSKRTQEAVVGKKCFYLDIDAGAAKFAKNPNTAWPTIQDALAALLGFIKKFGLKPTIILFSGGGLHIYWQLSEVLDGQAWTAIAENFKRVTKAAGLKADPTSTSDSARILRPPGSLHNNGQRASVLKHIPDAVYTRSAFESAVLAILPVPLVGSADGQLGDLLPLVPNGAVYQDSDAFNDDFAKFEPTPTSAIKIAAACGAVRECAETGGLVTEPQWRGVIAIVKHCVEGEALAHQWSNKHPEYDFAATQAKYDRYKAAPTTCETFSAYSGACSSCQFNGKIKSPIVLGRINEVDTQKNPELAQQVEAAAPPPPAPPPAHLGVPPEALGTDFKIELVGGRPMLYGKKTVIVKDPVNGPQKSSLWVKVTEDIFWLTGWTEAGRHDSETSTVSWTLLRKGQTQDFELPNEYTADRKQLLRYLAGRTINPLNHEPDTTAMLQQYINDQLRRIKDAAAKPVVRGHLGIHMDKDGSLYCAHGEYIIYPDGTIRRATLADSLVSVRDAFRIDSLPNPTAVSWGRDAWTHVALGARKQVDFYRKWWSGPNMENAQLAMMLMLASPVLVFAADGEMRPGQSLPAIGATVSLYSTQSAKGKTTLQQAIAYAYGDAARLIRQGDRMGTTMNAQVALAAALGTMPLAMDEVTANDAMQAAESINRMASAKEKDRANQQGKSAGELRQWALVSVVSTNVPQRELIAVAQKSSDALQMRLIELDFDKLPNRSLELMPQFEQARSEAMTGTVGSLGAILHLAIVSKGYATMRALVADKMKYVAAQEKGEIKERFLLRLVAAMLVANDMLIAMKLGIFDTNVLERASLDAMTGARTYSLSHNAEVGINFVKLVRDLAPHILITDLDVPTDDTLTPWENERTARTPYAGRLCKKSNTLYLAVDSCRKWAVENQLSPSSIMAEAKTNGFVIDFAPGKDTGQMALGKGIRGVWLPRQHVWKINASTLRVADIITDGVVTALHKGGVSVEAAGLERAGVRVPNSPASR